MASQIPETLVLEFKITLIWASLMARAVGSTAWSCMWCWVGQVAALQMCSSGYRTGFMGTKITISKEEAMCCFQLKFHRIVLPGKLILSRRPIKLPQRRKKREKQKHQTTNEQTNKKMEYLHVPTQPLTILSHPVQSPLPWPYLKFQSQFAPMASQSWPQLQGITFSVSLEHWCHSSVARILQWFLYTTYHSALFFSLFVLDPKINKEIKDYLILRRPHL